MLSLLVLSLSAWTAQAQTSPTTDAVCRADFAWANNLHGQSPCLMAAYLEGACGSGYWNVPALPAGNRYNPPSADQTNQCLCSSVTYSALSACAACQAATWVTWPAWKINCSPNLISVAAYTMEVPKNTSIPRWAYTDPTLSATSSFDIAVARTVSSQNLPDITVANSTSPPSTSLTPTATIPISSASTSPSPTLVSNDSRMSPGVIAGIAIGCVAVLCLVLGVVFFGLKLRRSSRASTAPSTQYINKWSKGVDRGAPPSSWGGSVFSSEGETSTMLAERPVLQAVPELASQSQSAPYSAALQFAIPPVAQERRSPSASAHRQRKPGSHNQNVITPFTLPPSTTSMISRSHQPGPSLSSSYSLSPSSTRQLSPEAYIGQQPYQSPVSHLPHNASRTAQSYNANRPSAYSPTFNAAPNVQSSWAFPPSSQSTAGPQVMPSIGLGRPRWQGDVQNDSNQIMPVSPPAQNTLNDSHLSARGHSSITSFPRPLPSIPQRHVGGGQMSGDLATSQGAAEEEFDPWKLTNSK